MICGMPCFTRDICGVDGMLLNPDVMLDNVVQEAQREAEAESEAQMGDDNDINAGVYVRDKGSSRKMRGALGAALAQPVKGQALQRMQPPKPTKSQRKILYRSRRRKRRRL